jgi:tripartite-type tricarboxylate transporter receptor subunit TctC
MNFTRRGFTAGAALLPFAAYAQDPAVRARLNAIKPAGFPRDPIEMTVVYPAGGGMDITARVVQRFFDRATGERSLVNNRTGGAGLVGHTWLATQAPADGHAVGIIANLIFSDAVRSQGRWSWTDLDHIAHINAEPLNLVVNAEGPFKTGGLQGILDAAKARPGTIRVLNVPGGYYEYLIEQLEAAAGARFLRVPFQGGAPGITALLGNNIDLGFGFFDAAGLHRVQHALADAGDVDDDAGDAGDRDFGFEDVSGGAWVFVHQSAVATTQGVQQGALAGVGGAVEHHAGAFGQAAPPLCTL